MGPSAMPFLCGALPAAQPSVVRGLQVLLCWQQAPTTLGHALHQPRRAPDSVGQPWRTGSAPVPGSELEPQAPHSQVLVSACGLGAS